jgi:hypothetical protein
MRPDPLASDTNSHPADGAEAPAGASSPTDAAPPGVAPSTPASAPLSPPPPPEPVAIPINWLLDHGSAPIRYRALVDLARVSPIPDRLLSLVYGYGPAVTLALSQRPEGTWHNAMLAVPPPRSPGFEGVGTIVAYRRLLEYGWDRDAPPLFHARRVLFRLLAEDNDPSLLFELSDKAKPDDDLVKRNRALLREAAAAALAQAGYESDPRLRGAAQRLLQRAAAHVRSPLATDPWRTIGGKRTLAPGASPPSYFLLLMLAYMPLFRLEHASEMDDLLKYLTNGAGSPESLQAASGQTAAQRYVIVGDPLADQDATHSDIAFVVAWLELAARLGFLKRHEPWSEAFVRLLDQCDDSFVWRARRGQSGTRAGNPFVWPTFPLVPNATADDHAADVTFRLGLIARFSGRPVELV